MPQVQFHRTEDIYFGGDKNRPELIAAIKENFIANDPPKEPESKEINPVAFTSESPIFVRGFSGENAEDLNRIVTDIVAILRNPDLVFKYLEDLDSAVGTRMTALGIQEEDNSPQYLIAGLGSFIPGPWPEGYKPLKKGRSLNEELLRRERGAGINIDGVAVFAGVVDGHKANEFVKDGHVFIEDEQVDKFLLHGKHSHRLFFEIIRQAEKAGELNLNVGGQPLTQKELLQIMVSTKLESSLNTKTTWETICDTTEDSVTPITQMDNSAYGALRTNMLNPDNYSFSSRSPFVLKSLITCFGKERLPSLHRYMLDGHYKQTAQIVDRVRKSDLSNDLTDVPDDFIYTSCMKAMSSGKYTDPGVLGQDFPFLETEASTRNKTEAFSEKYHENIRRKNNPQPSTTSPTYASFDEYIQIKNSSRNGSSGVR